MTPEEMRAAHPLISSSPNYQLILAARQRESIVSKLLSPFTAASVFVREYGQTFADVLTPGGSIYIGPGK